ncbi:MAG: DUF4837 family protein [Gemmatimonadota bacterium]
MMQTSRFASLSRSAASTLAIGLLLAGCDKPRALGDTNQILVAAPQAIWTALEDDIKAALEPTTFTVRDERVFDVAHIDPAEPGWSDVRLLRQILVIGTPDDPVVAGVVEAYDGEVPTPPSVVQVRNLWAQNQLVTLALLPEDADPEVARPLLGALGQTYLQQFESYARSRMFVTGPNEELADSLRSNAGFVLNVPRVYRYAQFDDVYVFRNDQPDPADLIRNINVDSRPSSEVEMTRETLADWRAQIAREFTQPPQVTDSVSAAQVVQVGTREALQVHGIWSNPPGEWPAGGPFIARLVECPDRTFMIDAWLYAPGVAKYEYMFQLNTILDSFECTG